MQAPVKASHRVPGGQWSQVSTGIGSISKLKYFNNKHSQF